MPDDERSSKPLARAWSSRPGLLIILFVILALAGVVASLAFVTSLLWLAVSVAIIATALAIHRWRRSRRNGS
jgi:Flp pilus assembly protein TadB